MRQAERMRWRISRRGEKISRKFGHAADTGCKKQKAARLGRMPGGSLKGSDNVGETSSNIGRYPFTGIPQRNSVIKINSALSVARSDHTRRGGVSGF
jgi:hypothetical protein